MNTHNKKCLTVHHAMEMNTDKILIDSEHFFTLANMIDDESYIHLIQQDTCLYDIQDREPEEISSRLQMKKKAAKKQQMEKIRRQAELRAAEVKLLRRELRIKKLHTKRIEQRMEKWESDGGVGNTGTKGKG